MLSAPLPDWTVVGEVVFVDPSVTVLTPAPVPTFTVLAVASALMLIVPVPEARDIAEFVETSDVPPDPDVIVIEVAPVALPNVLMLAPVVARVVAPTDVKVEPAVRVVVVAK